MKKLVGLILAASALAPASALAQHTVEPPVRWEDTPHAQMRVPAPHAAPPGVSWHAPAQGDRRPVHVQVHRPPHHGGQAPVVVQHHGPAAAHARNRVIVRHGGPGMRRHHGVKNYSRYHRIDRGFALPHAFWGPRFQIHNWSMYGLPQPIHGGRWVRYYDDALMIDGHGRVHDGRWGMTWDQWQDQWAYGPDGVPAYVGEGDYYPDEEDYGWVEGGAGGYAHGAPCPHSCAPLPPPPPPPYGHGYGYGYGHGYGYGSAWGWGGGMIVTETTTVTTHPSVVTETYYEEDVVHERVAKPRKYRAKPKVRHYRPKPPPGERG